MSRLAPVDVASATGKTKELLGAVQTKLGLTPNMMKTMARSPAVLEGYLNFSGALSHGVLDAKARERIAIALAQANACTYCLSAHSLLGKNAGLSDAEIAASRAPAGGTAKADAVVRFALAVNATKGQVTDVQFEEARSAGLNDAEIAETIANVALNVFTNSFNNAARVELDFPRVPLA
jgi:uncharacterized peroxidase-related enzyme